MQYLKELKTEQKEKFLQCQIPEIFFSKLRNVAAYNADDDE